MPNLFGVAGEHYVLSEMLRRGYIAALAPAGVPNTDIVVTDIEGSRLFAIQVKTRSGKGADGGWHMGDKHEHIRGSRLFYCFVDFQADFETKPQVYVVPSIVVADVLTASHIKWLGTPGRAGQARQDGKMRRFVPNYERIFGAMGNTYPAGWLSTYQGAWHLLGLDQLNPATETN